MRIALRFAVVLAVVFPLAAVAEEARNFDRLLGDDWYGVYLNGKKAGYAYNNFSREPGGGYVIAEDARFLLSMGGARQDMHINTRREYNADGSLRQLESRIESFDDVTVFKGVVKDDSLVLTKTVGGKTVEETLPRPRESLEDALKYSVWILGGPTVGDALDFSVFEPMYGKEIAGLSYLTDTQERILNGVPTKVHEIKTTMELIGIESTSFVAEDGTVLEDVIAGNMTLRLEPEEVAKDVDYSNDVIVSNAAMLDQPLKDARTRRALRLKVSGPLSADHLINEERQQFTPAEGHFIFEGRLLNLDGFPHPAIPVAEPSVQEWLKPTTYVQSDDPRVRARAVAIVGAETDSWKAATLICDWVNQNVRSRYSARLTNTLEVLQSLEGDCTEHSMLFVGLARAAGIPAREVAGLVYVESGERPGFYFHQWATVWVGKWIDVDPAFGQHQADATHIKLGVGDLIEQARLLPLIGQLKVEPLPESEQP
ncbi:MAG: hypothetical protein RLZZ303_3349 [Candidatus Hydrogenedentota bacterium]